MEIRVCGNKGMRGVKYADRGCPWLNNRIEGMGMQNCSKEDMRNVKISG